MRLTFDLELLRFFAAWADPEKPGAMAGANELGSAAGTTRNAAARNGMKMLRDMIFLPSNRCLDRPETASWPTNLLNCVRYLTQRMRELVNCGVKACLIQKTPLPHALALSAGPEVMRDLAGQVQDESTRKIMLRIAHDLDLLAVRAEVRTESG